MDFECEIVRVPPRKWGQKFYRYDVFLNGKKIVEEARDPEHTACRVLLERFPGCEKDVAVFCREGMPSLLIGIGWGAARKTEETDTRSPSTVKWRPYGNGTEKDEG